MKRKLTINASSQEAFAIVTFCERKGRSPLEVLLNACGYQNPEPEPFFFDIESFLEKRQLPSINIDDPTLSPSKKIRLKQQLFLEGIWNEVDNQMPIRRPKGDQNTVYLQLLSQLLKWDKEKVSAELEKRHGTRQQYFSRTGDVLQPHRIPNSDPVWYANTKLNADMKERILYKLLRKLNFTPTYSRFISDLVNNKRPQIAGLRFVSDETPK